MKLSTALQNKRLGVIVAILIVVMLLPFGFSGIRFAFARRDQMPDVFLEMPAPPFADCGLPPALPGAALLSLRTACPAALARGPADSPNHAALGCGPRFRTNGS